MRGAQTETFFLNGCLTSRLIAQTIFGKQSGPMTLA